MELRFEVLLVPRRPLAGRKEPEACGCNCFSSVGMLLFNKLAVQAFPLECCLVWLQLVFAAGFMLIFAFPYIHMGSLRAPVRKFLM